MRTALYARVSSDKQDVDLSISAQLKALRAYAARNGHIVVKEFVDQAESGRTAYRPQFREMISLAKRAEKPFELVLVYKYSRFARSREDFIVYKALLKKSKVQLISITEPLDDRAMGRLMQAIIECIDEFYSENLGEEVTRGMRESASRGFYLSCNPPYGYRKVRVNDSGKQRTKLEVNEFQSRVVASIFNQVINGKGLIEITRDLNSRGIAGPKGKGWSKTSLHKMLGNEVYAGDIVWGRNSKRGLPPIKVENACAAIVSRETFRQAQSLLEQRSFRRIHPRRTSSQYILNGLVHCEQCGKALIGTEAKGGKLSYYVCGTLIRKGAGSCPSRYYNAAKLENLVINKIREHILTPENMKELAELICEEFNNSFKEYRTEIDSIDQQLMVITRRLDRLYDVIETGNLSIEDISPRVRELRERHEKLQARKEELHLLMDEQTTDPPTQEEMTECVADLRKSLERGSLAEKKAFIRSFVKDIRMNGEEGKLTYTVPMPPQGLQDETESVLAIVHHGGRYRI